MATNFSSACSCTHRANHTTSSLLSQPMKTSATRTGPLETSPSPLNWLPLPGEMSKALKLLINDCRRLYGLSTLHTIEGELRTAKRRKGMTDDDVADQLLLGLDLEGGKATLLGVRVVAGEKKTYGRATRLRLNLTLRQAYWSNASGEWAPKMGTVLTTLINRVIANREARSAGQSSNGRLTLSRNAKKEFGELKKHGPCDSGASGSKSNSGTSSSDVSTGSA